MPKAQGSEAAPCGGDGFAPLAMTGLVGGIIHVPTGISRWMKIILVVVLVLTVVVF
ncbi:MAG: hypothetical protein NZT92_00405 [Abditibacteriales bacterium]|nr:hypothetical protein [Abditibacteriales bacterium]